MKILKESKTRLDASVLASYISDGWAQVASLKQSIQGVKASFTGEKVLVKYLEDILDAYLIGLGTLEGLSNGVLDMLKETKKVEESLELNESIEEDVIIDKVDVYTGDITNNVNVEDDLDTDIEEKPVVVSDNAFEQDFPSVDTASDEIANARAFLKGRTPEVAAQPVSEVSKYANYDLSELDNNTPVKSEQVNDDPWANDDFPDADMSGTVVKNAVEKREEQLQK